MHHGTRLMILVLAAAALLATGCGGDGTGSEANAEAAQVAGGVGSRPGEQAPDFTLPRLDGGSLTLSELRGKAVMVDFWDTWCGPCRKALPHLQELADAYGDDLVVVGVALARYGADDVRSYVQKNGLRLEMVLFDQNMKLLEDFAVNDGIPTTVLVDRDGVVRDRWVGGQPKSVYEKAVRRVTGA